MRRLFIIFLILFLFSFTVQSPRSEYNVHSNAESVLCYTQENNDNYDIVIGHLYNLSTNWTGISILNNDGYGFFGIDSFYLNGQHRDLIVSNFDQNQHDDLATQYYDGTNPYIGIVFDFSLSASKIDSIPINDYADYMAYGDINNDTYIDIVYACNFERYWGVIYNNGSGSFSSPKKYGVDFYPIGIACGDLNNDNRDDIVVSGLTEIFLSFPSGFQSVFLDVNNNDIELTDFDNDGDLDIIGSRDMYPYNYNMVNMIENMGNDSFNVREPFVFEKACHFQFVASDFNNDSLPDLLFHPMEHENIMILYNLGNFQLSEPQLIPVADYGEGSRKSACADLDGNGFNDIVTIRSMGKPLQANVNILFNDGNGNFVDDPVSSVNHQRSEFFPDLICYPNPFNRETTFEFTLKEKSCAELAVYDIQGKRIKCLTQKKLKGGNFKIKWTGLAENNTPCKPGTYFAYLEVNGKILQSIKLIKY